MILKFLKNKTIIKVSTVVILFVFTSILMLNVYYNVNTKLDSSDELKSNFIALSDKEYCEQNGGYYHSGGNGISAGCYALNEANCKIFGLEGKHSKCGGTSTNEDAKKYCEKQGNYYHSGGNGISAGCYALNETNCKKFNLVGKHEKCTDNSAADKEYCEKQGNYYHSGGNGISAGCYALNETNCKKLGFAWNSTTKKCTTPKKECGDYSVSNCPSISESNDECFVHNNKCVWAHGCDYRATKKDCESLTSCQWDINGNYCRFKGDISEITLTQKQFCEKDGNYYHYGVGDISAGCYVLNETNCKIFGFEWDSSNNTCKRDKRTCKDYPYSPINLCPIRDESGNKCKIVNSKCTVDNSKLTVTFDQYKGSGITCDNGTSVSSTQGKCIINVAKGKTTKFPTSTNMVRNENGYGYLIGWDNGPLQANGEPACLGGDNTKNSTLNKTSETSAINSDTTYRACYREVINGERFLLDGAQADGKEEFKCGQSFYVEYCTKESAGEYCYGTTSGGMRKIYKNKQVDSSEKALSSCNGEDIKEEDEDNEEYEETEFGKLKSCSNSTKNNMSGTRTYKDFCYEEDDTIRDIYYKLAGVECDNRGNCEINKREAIWKCESNSQILQNSIINKDNVKTCNKYGICVNDFSITCVSENSKPSISVTSGIAQGNGYGTITVKATSITGRIDSYYVSEYYLTPTNSSDGWERVSNDTFTITSTPGTKYIWVRDIYGNISNAVSGAVIDTTNTKTTLNKLELKDANGKIQTPSRISYNVDGFKSDKYVKLSNNLNKDSKVIADGFNPFDTEYKIEVDSPTISVYATLTSTDSKYVSGYEPRTVNLNYGVNTILIKIEDNEGKIRTYTILVTRTDTRVSDNTLSDISVSEGSINFNANVTDYKIEIPASVTSVEVKSTIASDKASYVSGYEPGNVSIIKDTTVKLIKVKSQTGSTRTYVLTFIKKGKDEIKDESLQLAELVIPNVYVPFEKDVANYNITVGYETDVIDLNTVLNDENSKAIISVKKKSDSDYKLTTNTGIKLDVGENFIEIEIINSLNQSSYYRFTIIRKEVGLGISNDTALKDLSVLGYDIEFNPMVKEYTVKIKQEKSLVITAVPNSNRAEVFIRGNDELTGFSTVRIKVVAENGEYETYSIDIKKDAFNKTIEIASIVAGVVIILISSGIIIVKKKNKAKKEYFEE